jgi:hypothetical protein
MLLEDDADYVPHVENGKTREFQLRFTPEFTRQSRDCHT